MKRLTPIVVLLMGMLVVSGCWDRREVNDMAIVIAMAMDKEPNGHYRLSVQVPLVSSLGSTSGGGGGTSGDKTYYVDSAVGKTIREANSMIQSRMSRELYYSHHRMIVIGEQLAKEGMSDVLDIVARFPENRLTAYLVMTKGKGIELLNAQPQFERFSGEAMRELVKMEAIPVSLKDVAQMLTTPGIDAFLPVLAPVDSHPKGKSKEVEFTGIGLFRGDKLVYVSKAESIKGLRWFQRNFMPFSVVLSLGDKGRLTFYFSKGKADLKPVLKKGRVHYDIMVHATSVIVENMTNLDLEHKKNIAMIEDMLKKEVEVSVKNTLQLMQKYRTDTIGMGLIMARQFPREWRETYRDRWSEELPEITFTIRSKVAVEDIGQTTKNITKEDRENE
ncbi:putative spore germination protein YfkR [Brevibacillus agri]|uniref:Ger(X)C family spore germination protein n=1 Tax=Brevibacillus agri TaxID=51101 RepID=A0A3M8AZF0_9BACL|nr:MULTISPECIES: Ger(x)C family spore germination protein [Brevibacillus]EJL46999.1 germination protein, Ger(X)C family [Brevibacillus sp. CF112]MDN4094322.1 Ger(x)C family spore germination protein [Brevibacillus agri]MED3496991.1 Ger(x)C family spore germination protein [Brevibacillus agri]QAV13568.1 Ger(x)C family spore germination protein [Brevibacillus agri]RNB56393.1 Ger(x)C family spore germination protein [Brevibacillus agri]